MLRHADVEQGVWRLGATEGGPRGWAVRGGGRDHMPVVQVR